jgi:outer membrane biosynthesis protein TonB
LQITVGVDGHIHDPQVITSTSPALTAAALKSVSQWLCNPYKLNGEPVEAEEEVTLTMTRLPPY